MMSNMSVRSLITTKEKTVSINLKIGIIVYSVFLIINSFFQEPYFDAFYYWSWGQHLAFGYLDGPPLVAYAMRFFDFIFGHTLFAINSYGVFTTLCAAFFVFKIAKILSNNKPIGLGAALLWLISNNTQVGLITRVSYDNLEELFWLATVFFVLEYLQLKLNRSLYYAGIALGLLLLSKYSGVVLILGLIIFFIFTSNERVIFKNKHFYFATLVMLLIFSPNFVWNFKHHWQTFIFQQQAHPMSAETHLLSMTNFLIETIKHHIYALPVIIFLAIKHHGLKSNKLGWRLMRFVFLVLLFFWLVVSYFSTVYHGYVLLLNVPLMILLSYYLIQFQYHKTLGLVIAVYSVTSILQMVLYDIRSQANGYELALSKEFQQHYSTEKIPAIVGGSYVMTSKVFFINPTRVVLSIAACEDQANQFQYWNHPAQQALMDHKLAQAFYMDFSNNPNCIKSYFKSCTPLPALVYESPRKHNKNAEFSHLYIYKCQGVLDPLEPRAKKTNCRLRLRRRG